MQLYSRKESIERMNDLAGKGRPFLFVTDYRQEHSYVEEISEVDSDFCRYSFNGVTNVEKECEEYDGTLIWEVAPPALEEYRIAFDVVKDNIWAGNSYLTNLTCKVPVETNLTLEAIFRYSDAKYKLWLKDTLVCFSPEIFVRIEEGKIKSFPMKGTIDASLPDARRLLMNDRKEAAEHGADTSDKFRDLRGVA